MQIATKTLEAINKALEIDQGAKFRGLFRDALVEISDAFNDVPDLLPRTHLGASLIGRDCMRALWYSFRWVHHKMFDGRMLRLFHRGHLEEARFIALCRVAGMTTWHSENGKQFRISGHGGHYGGSLDGVAFGCPDLPDNTNALLEFKTHGKNSFSKLVKEGVRLSKPEHYVQCNQYMGFYGLPYAIYMAVEKDTDHIHIEIIQYDRVNREMMWDRAGQVLASDVPPPRCNESPSWYTCKWCDYWEICHNNGPITKTCRTCKYSKMQNDGTWQCLMHDTVLNKEQQFAGCDFHASTVSN